MEREQNGYMQYILAKKKEVAPIRELISSIYMTWEGIMKESPDKAYTVLRAIEMHESCGVEKVIVNEELKEHTADGRD